MASEFWPTMPVLSVEVKPNPIVPAADASRSRRPLPDKVKALLDDLHRGEATADRLCREGEGLRRLGSIVPGLTKPLPPREK
jgi:hypothetical protein